jgi:hypothetical protein
LLAPERAAVNRDAAIELLDRLHDAQNEFYAGGSGACGVRKADRRFAKRSLPALRAAEVSPLLNPP